LNEVYLVEYSNGDEYDRNNYIMAVFDDYEKAVQFCIDQGYEQKNDGYFEMKYEKFEMRKESLSIDKVEMNIKINWWND
jgi:hypothetical protein